MSLHPLEGSVRRSLHGRSVMLAISGGADSMALLHASARVARQSVCAVAVFDHGTGDFARRAVALVSECALSLGFPIVSERAAAVLTGEQEWRAARWRFLRQAACSAGGSVPAAVATAHTLDDQVETVAMRILRGSGARGLAGLYARNDIVRPLLAHRRHEIFDYVANADIPYLDDPTNESLAYLRNRLRLEILPVLRRADPSIDAGILAIARQAERWRREVEGISATIPVHRHDSAKLVAEIEALKELELDQIAVLAPALLARMGVTLDRRGIVSLARLLHGAPRQGRVQLSGGYEAERTRGRLAVLRSPGLQPEREPSVLSGELKWADWTFSRTRAVSDGDAWSAWLPASEDLSVRAWRSGDRMRAARSVAERRVKRYLSDAGIKGADRKGWPVVMAGETIIWIPGIRRGLATTLGPGEKRIGYVCRRIDR